MKHKRLIVVGIRGIPAQHGGFETFAEHLCLYLKASNWDIDVYCQDDGSGSIYESRWNGINRIHIPVKHQGPLGTIIFDFRSILHSLNKNGVFLILGYNTAIFNILYRIAGKINLINMDGIEWKRQKWGSIAKVWFYLNERLGCWFGNHLVADHPEIKRHLSTRVSPAKISMIPYGANEINSADKQFLSELAVDENQYAVVIARAEPENSILEIVTAFSEERRDIKLIVLGRYEPESNAYHKAVQLAASEEVIFPGAIYDSQKVEALRFYARFYIHGHQVGGTNPSLVEALGAGNPILAHDNKYNRWVAGEGALYFSDLNCCSEQIKDLLMDDNKIQEMKESSRARFQEAFQWKTVLNEYEELLIQWSK
jgi:glycosyltransferase involved in cell wall biosynthesis